MFELGREVAKTVGNKTYVFARLERRIIEQFRDWIAEREGDVFALAKETLALGIEKELAKEIIEDCKSKKAQLAAFSMGCPLAEKYLKTELGFGELFYLLLRDKQPDITRDEAQQVFFVLAEEATDILQKTQGKPPSEKNGSGPV